MQVFDIPWKWNIPNGLSLLRILLVPVFAVLYLLEQDTWALAALAVSGLTDCLDGTIARKLNQITECGKLLDPLADKLTQVTVAVCLTFRHRYLIPLAFICLAKEICQFIGGVILLRRQSIVHGSLWFGKASTVIFYLSMLFIVTLDHMDFAPRWVIIIPVSLAAISMALAFLGYWQLYIHLRRDNHSGDPAAELQGKERPTE